MKRIFPFLAGAAALLAIFLSSCSPKEEIKMIAVTLPPEGLTDLSGSDIGETEFKALAAGSGRSDLPGIAPCPYYSLRAGELEVPLYSTPVYLGSTGAGALHSWGTVEVSQNAFPLSLSLEITGFSPADAMVLPESLGVSPELSGSLCTAGIEGFGSYTFLFNGASQEYSLTVFVREYSDEEAEIGAYRAEYGAENVLVFEPGLHRIDRLDFQGAGKVFYFRRGSLICANHMIDMDVSKDKYSIIEGDAPSRSIYPRYPFINAFEEKNIVIDGSGTVDFSGLWSHERAGMCFVFSSGIKISGLTLVNPAMWAATIYRCEDIEISDTAIFGYRINSDGIAVCNSKNAVIRDCFARSGDDLFEVKTLGGPDGATAENILFENCTAWNGKARCFGVIAEVNHPVSDVTFKNCAVIYRDATWDQNILGSLVVFASEGVGKISNVLFENIEIFNDFGSPINCTAMPPPGEGGYEFSDIVFRNIRVRSGDFSTLSGALSRYGNKISVLLENIEIRGELLTAENIDRFFYVYNADFEVK